MCVNPFKVGVRKRRPSNDIMWRHSVAILRTILVVDEIAEQSLKTSTNTERRKEKYPTPHELSKRVHDGFFPFSTLISCLHG
jgi:hypothetical protein